MRIITLMILIMTLSVPTSAAERVLTTKFDVNAPIEKVWNAWTTAGGVKTFFAPGCQVEPRVDGRYDIFFSPDAKPGERGAEGMRILGFEPLHRFAFTWSNPPSIPEIRDQRTMVTLEFKSLNINRTRVQFAQVGWGEGESWDRAYEYFDRAWNEVVLPRFRYAMEVKPIDWQDLPRLKPVAATLKVVTRP